MLVGCGGTRSHEGSGGPARPRTLERADAAFLAGDWAGAAAEYRAAVTGDSDGPWAAGARYRLAVCFLEQGLPAAARDLLREAEEDNRDPGLAAMIAVARGDAEGAAGNPAGAVEAYRAVLERRDDRFRRDHVLFRLAECERRVGDETQARAHFLEVASAYPTSPYAAAARTAVVGGERTTPGASGSAGAMEYTAQVGAFADPAGAAARAREVRRAGFACDVRPSVREGRALYVVTFGRYATWGEANVAAGRLRAKGISAIVAP